MFRFWLSYAFYWWGVVHRYMGTANNVASEFRRAADYFGRAYAIDPTFHRAKLDRAIMLWRELGELEPALILLDELIAHEATYAPALLNRALIYQQMWNLPACQADLEAYLQVGEEGDMYWDTAVRSLARVRQMQESAEAKVAPSLTTNH